MKNNPLPRLDTTPAIRQALLPFCRLRAGGCWDDPVFGHRVGCLDAAAADQVARLMDGQKAKVAIHDPPYNLVAFEERPLQQFTEWCGPFDPDDFDAGKATRAMKKGLPDWRSMK